MEYNCLKVKKSLQKKVRKFTVQDGLAGACITALCKDAEGKLYVGTTQGLSVFFNNVFVNIDGIDCVDKLFADEKIVFVCSQNKIIVLQNHVC